MRYITLECDTTQHTDLHLLRKYPDKRRMRAFREQLKGAVLVGSDDERRSFDTLLTIKETPQPYLQEYKFKNEKCYRFYRLSAPTGASVNISHMEFLTSSPKEMLSGLLLLYLSSTKTLFPIQKKCTG